MKRRPRPSSTRYDDRYSDRYSERSPERSPRSSAGSILNSTTLAILGAVLVVGIGLGAFFGYTANSSVGGSIDTRVEIDASVPNADLCAQYGAGAIAVDLRAFVTLSPFKVFISQPLMQPGCVLRTNNWNILQQRDVIDTEEARECKQRMNTFGFTGDIEQGGEGAAKVDCVYANDTARNLFLKNGLGTGLNGDRF
ncbi:MAG: DUF3172 domain-containing protein [Merismopedia sp. SIO2A8]|nr:DUF3172 domain-containing protein [Merismopedia sp. SIO2A8]